MIRKFLRDSFLGFLFLSRFQWGRKLLGGKWELWWVDAPIHSNIWHLVEEFYDIRRMSAEGVDYWKCRPTPLCRGTPIEKEEWS